MYWLDLKRFPLTFWFWYISITRKALIENDLDLVHRLVFFKGTSNLLSVHFRQNFILRFFIQLWSKHRQIIWTVHLLFSKFIIFFHFCFHFKHLNYDRIFHLSELLILFIGTLYIIKEYLSNTYNLDSYKTTFVFLRLINVCVLTCLKLPFVAITNLFQVDLKYYVFCLMHLIFSATKFIRILTF